MRPVLAFAALLTIMLAVVIARMSTSDTPVAEASSHEVRIYAVMGGGDNDDSIQFVELRQAIGGQNQVQNAQLCFYDENGVPWARFVFPAMANSGSSQSSILVASQAMADAWNVSGGATPDVIFSAANTMALDQDNLADVTAPIVHPNGAIVYEANTPDTSCGSPLNPIDAISYGTGFTGGALIGNPEDTFDEDLPINGNGFRLKTTPVTFPPTDNSTEYEVATCLVARNNAGVSGPVGEGCPAPTPSPSPSPTPTASPSPTPTPSFPPCPTPFPNAIVPQFTCAPLAVQGDGDCDLDVDANDGLIAVRDAANAGSPTCFGARTDIDCDNAHSVIDALEIFRYAAGIFTRVAPQPGDCISIGLATD